MICIMIDIGSQFNAVPFPHPSPHHSLLDRIFMLKFYVKFLGSDFFPLMDFVYVLVSVQNLKQYHPHPLT